MLGAAGHFGTCCFPFIHFRYAASQVSCILHTFRFSCVGFAFKTGVLARVFGGKTPAIPALGPASPPAFSPSFLISFVMSKTLTTTTTTTTTTTKMTMSRFIWLTLHVLTVLLLVDRHIGGGGVVVVNAIPQDEHENCEMWASSGECENNPEYMMHHCARSCALEKAHREVAEEQLKGIESFFDLSAPDIDGNEIKFEEFRGKVTILTNVASYCGYTQQHYRELVELWSHLENESVEILAFPCNQFGKQEPGTAEEIKQFAHSKGVKFRIMTKVNVNGPQASLVCKKILPRVALCLIDGEEEIRNHSVYSVLTLLFLQSTFSRQISKARSWSWKHYLELRYILCCQPRWTGLGLHRRHAYVTQGCSIGTFERRRAVTCNDD